MAPGFGEVDRRLWGVKLEGGGVAPTGRHEVGISPSPVLGGGHVRKAAHDGEASASSSSDGANSPHGSFGSSPSLYSNSTTRTSSFYGWFGARKLETIQRWWRLEGERWLHFGVGGRVAGRDLYRGKPLVYE
jgi:hypothetical protein